MELDQFRDVDLVIDRANDSFVQKQFVSQGDYKGRSLTVQVTDNGSVGEVPGLTLNLRWHNEASGLTDLSAFSVIDASNSIFRIEYPQNMMTPGKVFASIQILQNGKTTQLKEFELTVQRLAGEAVGIVEKAEFSALVAILADSNKFRTDIDKKADKTFVTAQLAQKATKGEIGLSDLDKNKTQFDQTWISDSLRQMIAGTAPINAVPADGSITTQKLAKQAVDYTTTDFITIGSNLFNKFKAIPNYGVSTANGALYGQSGLYASEFIPVTPSTAYYKRNGSNNIVYYDQDKKFISALNGALGFTTPSNCYYIRTTVQANFLDNMMINVGDRQKPFEEYYYELKLSKTKDLATTADVRPIGKNILDVRNAVIGKRINPDGNLNEATTNFRTSGILLAEPNTQYTAAGVTNILELDEYKIPISQGYHEISEATGSFVTKSNTKFLRVTFSGTGAFAQIEKGTQYTGYEPVKYGLFTQGREVPISTEGTANQIPVLTEDPVLPTDGQIWINVGG